MFTIQYLFLNVKNCILHTVISERMRYLSGTGNDKNYIDMHYTCAGALKGYDDLLTAGYGARSRQQSLDRGTAVSRYCPYVRQQDFTPCPLVDGHFYSSKLSTNQRRGRQSDLRHSLQSVQVLSHSQNRAKKIQPILSYIKSTNVVCNLAKFYFQTKFLLPFFTSPSLVSARDYNRFPNCTGSLSYTLYLLLLKFYLCIY